MSITFGIFFLINQLHAGSSEAVYMRYAHQCVGSMTCERMCMRVCV